MKRCLGYVLSWAIISIALDISGQQLQIVLQPPPVSRFVPEDLFSVTLTNPLNESLDVYLLAVVVKSDGSKALQLRSQNIRVSPGLNRFTSNKIIIANTTYSDKNISQSIRNTGNLPPGMYSLCTQVWLIDQNLESGQICLDHKVQENPSAGIQQQNIGEKIKLFGRANIEGQWASRQGNFQNVPDQYLRLDLRPRISFYAIPLGLDVLYSTENSQLAQRMNSVSFFFDVNQFKNKLRSAVTEKVLFNQQLKALNERKDLKKLQELDHINRFFDDPSIKNEMLQIQELGDIQQQLKDGDLLQSIQTINDLNRQIRQRVSNLNYEIRKKEIDGKILLLQTLTDLGPEKNRQRKLKMDSLRLELNRLENRNDSLAQVNEADMIELGRLQQYKDAYEQLMRRYRQLESLAAKKEQIEKLLQRKSELEQFKSGIEAAGSLGRITGYDFSRLSDSDELKNQLKNFNLYSKTTRFFYGIKELKIGTIFPYYSPLTVDGLQMTGGSIELNPGLFYFAVAGGKNKQAVFANGTSPANFSRNIITARMGIGKENKSYFHLTALRSWDDEKSIESDTLLAESNIVVGAKTNLILMNQKFVFHAEVAASKYDRDKFAPKIITDSRFLDWLPEKLQPNFSSSFDLAYNARLEIRLKNTTRLLGFLKSIGPGFRSFGAPALRTDLLRYEARLEQKLLKGQMTVSGFFRREEDNIHFIKRSRTLYLGGGFDARLHFKNLPFFNINFLPTSQSNEYGDHKLNILTLTTGHHYGFGNLNGSSILSYGFNHSEGTQSAQMYENKYATFSQLISFSFPLSISANFNYIQNTISDQTNTIYGAELSISFLVAKKISGNIGSFFYKNEGIDQTYGATGELTIAFNRNINLSLIAESKRLNHQVDSINNFEEVYLRSRMIVNW